jgi:hypothetical protein
VMTPSSVLPIMASSDESTIEASSFEEMLARLRGRGGRVARRLSDESPA